MHFTDRVDLSDEDRAIPWGYVDLLLLQLHRHGHVTAVKVSPKDVEHRYEFKWFGDALAKDITPSTESMQ